MILGKLLSFEDNLEKVNQSGWFEAPTKLSPSSYKELGIDQINNYGSSWMKIILNSLLDSKIISVRSLFFQIFCEKSLMFLIIMLVNHLQLSKLIAS